jgi:hypothetical protein
MKNQPQAGFATTSATEKTGGDAYQVYNDAVLGVDQVFDALQTEAGRQAVGAQMAVPIREQLDYVGVARKFLEIDILAQGQIIRYDKDIKKQILAFVVAKNGAVDQVDVNGEYVEPNTWEIFADANIRLSEIQQRRFNILDRTQECLKIAIQEQEDLQFIALLNATTAGNLGSIPYTIGTHGCSKTFLNDLSASIMDNDVPQYAFLMRFKSFADLRIWSTRDLDPVSMREVLETGLYGSIWGIDIIVSRLVQAGNVYALAEPRFFGVMPIRTELILMPDDMPKQASIGYVAYEEIGMACLVANGVARGFHTGTAEQYYQYPV